MNPLLYLGPLLFLCPLLPKSVPFPLTPFYCPLPSPLLAETNSMDHETNKTPLPSPHHLLNAMTAENAVHAISIIVIIFAVIATLAFISVMFYSGAMESYEDRAKWIGLTVTGVVLMLAFQSTISHIQRKNRKAAEEADEELDERSKCLQELGVTDPAHCPERQGAIVRLAALVTLIVVPIMVMFVIAKRRDDNPLPASSKVSNPNLGRYMFQGAMSPSGVPKAERALMASWWVFMVSLGLVAVGDIIGIFPFV